MPADLQTFQDRARDLPDIDLPTELWRAHVAKQEADARYQVMLEEVLRRGAESPQSREYFIGYSQGILCYANNSLIRFTRAADEADQYRDSGQKCAA